MGQFSDYVSSINEQTNTLRENLTNATGVDCSKKSISACAEVVADYVPELEKEEVYYDRPSWYPDIKAILNSAPEITVDSNTYYPAYIVLLNNLYKETPFYRSYSGTSTAINYYKNTGGAAVLCSDRCNNNISNASADTLEIGTEIMHTWDTSKDISNPDNPNDTKVRWAIIYHNSLNLTNFYISGYNDWIEIITGKMNLSVGNFQGNSNARNNSIKYIEVQENANAGSFSSSTTAPFCYLHKLEVLILNFTTDKFNTTLTDNYSLKYIKFPIAQITQKYSNSFESVKKIEIPQGATTSVESLFESVYNLKSIILPNGFQFKSGFYRAYCLERVVMGSGNTIISGNTFSQNYKLKEVILPNDVISLDLSSAFSITYSLKYLKIPSTVKELIINNSNSLGFIPYIELFNDFNISAVNFTGRTTKDLQWLRDLCIWLKDRTGEEANTMIIGAKNIENAENLWLTFNPDDKRDITWVDAGTEGAINILQFLTEQLNWTFS